MTAIVAVTGLGAAIFLFFYGWKLRRMANIEALGIAHIETGTVRPRERSSRQTLEAQVATMAKKYASFGERYPQIADLLLPVNLAQRLAWAGNPLDMHGREFIGVQLVSMFLGALCGLYTGVLFFGMSGITPVLGFVGALLGAPLAIQWLNGQAEKRQRLITRALPDAIELISAAVVAGLDPDRAIERTVKNVTGPLGEEFQRFLHELQFGTPREEAFHNLMWRNRSEEMQTIIGALLQGHNLGVPIHKTLEDQAAAMRERRLQRAKEEGAKATPKIALITVGLIVPSVFLMFMVVLGYRVYRDISPLMGVFGG